MEDETVESLEGLIKSLDSNEFIGEWLIQHECARDLSLSVGKINNCLKGKRLSHKGYRFVFKWSTCVINNRLKSVELLITWLECVLCSAWL